ncbi:putative uba domain-containing protein [Diaporthe ampelina]|uniref:Putative uba domain-containing protein n=1 Tax=Diaporthe ampelina TaxID=1214573 RepID=A0A0G2H2I4_9PEZI|nr:putative uba domain-containing protein [Diaporthe ampelina]
MDDLAGMDWSSTSSTSNQKKPPMNSSSAFASFPSLQPTPSPVNSGRNTPLSSHASGQLSAAGSKASAPAPTKPAHDAFSNLMATSSAKSTAKLSLAERQKQLEAEKLKKLQERKQQQSAAYGDGQFWDALGQGSSSGAASRTASPALHAPGLNTSAQNAPPGSDDDLFAAFNKDTKVDNASHYPPPASGKSTPALDLSSPSAWSQPAQTSNGNNGSLAIDDDDPFGLNQLQAKPAPAVSGGGARTPAAVPGANDDELDDLLGDLGKPVDEVRRKQEAQRQKAPPKQESEPGKPIEDSDSSSSDDEAPRLQEKPQRRPQRNDPFDKAVAQIMEMGFSPEDAARGLTESGQGLNVQAAVSYLLNDAHQKAREKTQRGASMGVTVSPRASPKVVSGSVARIVSELVQKPLELIGPGKGEGENVPLQDETSDKRDMKDLYGKALTRKAEALEQMERWAEAGTVWQSCVESGVGGPTATAGRQRCQKALAPKPKPASKPATPAASRAPPRPRPAAPAKDSEAVTRLQQSNKAAEAADAERFALSDQVDARIAAWRDGKRENLRALLASLDQVLWEGSGWKKVGLHELVMANRVKIVYMKAIAKTHPDKLAQDASIEARMIAATVFSTLNESWDKFKTENGL